MPDDGSDNPNLQHRVVWRYVVVLYGVMSLCCMTLCRCVVVAVAFAVVAAAAAAAAVVVDVVGAYSL